MGACVCAWVVASAIVFLLRFRAGRWRSMRVIEEAPSGRVLDVETPQRMGEAKAGI